MAGVVLGSMRGGRKVLDGVFFVELSKGGRNHALNDFGVYTTSKWCLDQAFYGRGVHAIAAQYSWIPDSSNLQHESTGSSGMCGPQASSLLVLLESCFIPIELAGKSSSCGPGEYDKTSWTRP